MAIDPNTHNYVIVQDETTFFGFPHLYSAVALIERQIPIESAVEAIRRVLKGGGEIDGVKYEIMDIETFLDNYESDETVVSETV